MQTISADTPDATATPDGRFLAERMHIQQRCLGVLAHQLGNVASPIALVAEVLQLDAQLARRDAAIATLRRVAGVLSQLTAVTRSLRGADAPGQLVPRGIDDVAAWWALYGPFAESMLPEAVRLEASLAPSPLSPQLADALTWILPASLAHVHAASGAATVITMSSAWAEGSGTVRFDIQAPGAAGIADAVMQGGLQWVAFARSCARRIGGELAVSDATGSPNIVLQLSTPRA